MAGKRITSLIFCESVNNIERRSIPRPQPAAGGIPYSSACQISSSRAIASSNLRMVNDECWIHTKLFQKVTHKCLEEEGIWCRTWQLTHAADRYLLSLITAQVFWYLQVGSLFYHVNSSERRSEINVKCIILQCAATSDILDHSTPHLLRDAIESL